MGAGLLAKVVNDDAGILDERGALRFFASNPAPTEKQICFRSGRYLNNGYAHRSNSTKQHRQATPYTWPHTHRESTAPPPPTDAD
ncbi:hypothetical protein C1X81_30605 [Pseudomonas sp. FW215-L2]|nr:hypothetical protein C1X81_30605 [Pseudomonas sp. FW215-L2]PMU68011.1 hypothetical protein C1X91_33915 [Pseudomonas sp. GP01-A5]